MGLRREFDGGASAAVIGRLHGRPAEVIPLHVVEGFLESERPSRDSGVLAKKGIVDWGCCSWVENIRNSPLLQLP